MGIKTRNPISVRGLEQRLLEARSEAFKTACEDAVAEILARTGEGKDYRGVTFDEYSESYAAVRRRANKQIDPPNLNFTSEMVKALQVKFQDLGEGKQAAEFYFEGASASKKARFVNETREFFRLSKEQLTAIRNKIRKATR